MPVCPVPGCSVKIRWKRNVKRHIKRKADGGDRAHYDYLSSGEASSKPQSKGAKAKKLGQTRSPGEDTDPSPSFTKTAVPGSPEAEEERKEDLGTLEFPDEVGAEGYEVLAEPEPAPEEVPSHNTYLLLNTVLEWSIAVRDGDIGSLSKLTKEELRILARAIAMNRGKDLDEMTVLWVAGEKFAMVVAGNFIIGVGKYLKKRREEKEKRLQELKERREAGLDAEAPNAA